MADAHTIPQTAPPRARRRRLGCFFWLLLPPLLLVGGIFLVGWKVEPLVRPPRVAAWAIDKFLPALELEIRDFAWEGTTGLVLDGIRLREKQNGEILAEIARFRIAWTASGLWNNSLDLVEISDPVLRLTPATLAALTPAPSDSSHSDSTHSPSSALSSWRIGRLHCDYGQLITSGLGTAPETPLETSARFSFDWKNFSPASGSDTPDQSLLLWGMSASLPGQPPLLSVDWLRVQFSPGEVLRKGWIEEFEIKGGHFALSPEARDLLMPPGDPAAASPVAASSPGTPKLWLGRLALQDFRIELVGAAPLGAKIDFELNTVLQSIPLGNLPETLGSETQLIELARIELRSPLDPLVRIITIHSVFVYFTLDGLLKHRLERIVLLNPVLYLSQDLFVYMEQMRESSPGEKSDPTAGLDWVIEALRIEYGSLILGGEKLGQVGLPLSFSTSATDVRLDSLASLRLRADLEIRTQDFSFPPLQLDLFQLGGDLKFSYPSEEDLNNLVNVLRLDRLQWRQFSAKNLWLAATFDARGIFALAGGESYNGYVNAGVSFFFEPEGRWVGWVTGQGIDLQRLTAVLAPQNFEMTGPADFKIEVDGSKKVIQRLRGSLEGGQPGLLRITKLDDLLENIPPEWGSLKRSSTILALETLRDFRYTSAMAEFWYIEEQGRLRLRMPGPAGSRNLDLRLHADETTDGLWKIDTP